MEKPDSHSRDEPLRSRVVVIAASLGGLRAVEQVLQEIPRQFPAPIVLVQHLSERHPTQYVEVMKPNVRLPMQWIDDQKPLDGGVVYVAPPGYHATIDARSHALLSKAPPVNFVRPAADLLFQSAAQHLRERTIAVVLTGRLSDGASGALAVRRAGGAVIAQDPATCAAPGMPRAAIAAGAVHFVLPPNAISRALVALTMVRGAPEMFGWT